MSDISDLISENEIDIDDPFLDSGSEYVQSTSKEDEKREEENNKSKMRAPKN